MEVKNKKIKGAAAFVGTLLTKPIYLPSKFLLENTFAKPCHTDIALSVNEILCN